MARMGKSIVGTGLGTESEIVWGDEVGTEIDAETGEILDEWSPLKIARPSYAAMAVARASASGLLGKGSVQGAGITGGSVVDSGSIPGSGSGPGGPSEIDLFSPDSGAGIMDMLPMIAVVGGGLLAAYLLLVKK